MIYVMTSASFVGWLATAVIVASYCFKDPANLRRVQAVSALLWMSYGLMIHSAPVIVANIIVFAAAALSSVIAARRLRKPQTQLE
jgi:ABC-type antimicrobial peptide transport system permease subunit